MSETSTLPLNLAYKAAQLVECRPTIKFDEILRVVRKTNLSVEDFVAQHENGNALAALNEDL